MCVPLIKNNSFLFNKNISEKLTVCIFKLACPPLIIGSFSATGQAACCTVTSGAEIMKLQTINREACKPSPSTDPDLCREALKQGKGIFVSV